tara:strand:+ start:315 stop:479 length:165 start_codon:yes stop_codon:yes gene_type:complete
MADIKTMSQEITDLNLNLKERMLSGDYDEVVTIFEKIIEKLDELVAEVNTLKNG